MSLRLNQILGGADIRSPIFYDSNDTGYYLDPASTSRLNTINVGASGVTINNAATAAERNLKIKAGGSGTSSVGLVLYDSSDTFRCQLYSEPSNYGFLDGLWAGWDIRKTIGGSLFLNNNTTYYLNPASTTVLNALSVSVNNGLNPAVGTWHTSSEGKARFYFASNDTTYFRTGNNFVFRNNSDIGVVTIDSVGNLRTSTSGDNFASYSLHVGGTGFASADFRSPIFYDSNNTAYYIDAASTSNLNNLTVAGTMTFGTLAYVTESRRSKNSSNVDIETVTGLVSPSGPTFLEIRGFCPPTMFRTTGDRPAPYGIGFGNGAESGGIMPIGAGDNLQEIMLYGSNTGPTTFTFKRQNWESNTYDPSNSNSYSASVFSINTGTGAVTASTDIRSPIYYDSNNTSYYLDPASTSVINAISIAGNSTFSGDSYLTFGPNSTWGSSIRFGGNGYTATGTEMASVVTTDGNLHLDAAKSTNGIYLNWYGGTSGVFFGNGSAGQAAFVSSSGNAVFNGSVTTTYGSFTAPALVMGDAQYGFYVVSGNVYYKSASGGVHYWRNIANSANTMSLDNSGSLNLAADVRAPIFYDSDNTAYYINGASGSKLKYLQIDGDWGSSPFGSGHESFTIRSTYASFCQRQTNGNLGYWLHHIPTDGSYMLYGGRGATDGSSWDWSYRAYPNQDGSFVEFRTSARAPIFYDSNDTSYYVDPASTSIMLYVRAANFHDSTGSYNVNLGSGNTEGRGLVAGYSGGSYGGIGYNVRHTTTGGSWIAPLTDTSTYLLFSNGIYFYYAAGGAAGRTLSYSTIGSLTSAGIFTVSGDVRAPIFYDSNDTTYYLNPADVSYLYEPRMAYRTLIGAQSYDATLFETPVTTRPGIVVRGSYPHIEMVAAGIDNVNHGATLRFVGYDTGGATTGNFKHWVIGCPATNLTGLYFGYSPNQTNPHYGIGRGWSSGNDVSIFWILNDREVYAENGVRATIFYDRNNTAYYTDPASTSVLYSIAAGVAGNSSANIPALKVTSSGTATTQAAIAIQQQASEGDTIIFCDYDQYVEWNLVHENVNNQLIIHGGTSTSNLGSNTFYSPNGTAKTGYIKHVFDMTDGNAYIGGSVGIGTNVPSQKLDVRGTIISNSDVRAPLFYDSDNTGYYLNPAGSSQLSAVYANDWFRAQGNTGLYFQDKGYGITSAGAASNSYGNASTYGSGLNGWQGWGIGSRHCMMSTGGDNFGIHDNTRSWLYYWDGTYHNFQYGYLQSASSVRGPLFYDSDNTAYYCDPASTSNLNAITAAGNITAAQYYTGGWFRNNGSGNGLYNESTTQHFYSDSVNYWNVASSAGAQGIRFRTGGHNGTVRGYVYANDSNDVGFLNSGGNWRARIVGGDYALFDGSSIRGQIFYDSNDTNYYCDPNGSSVLASVSARGYYPVAGVTESDIYAQSLAICAYHHGDSLTYDTFQFNAASTYETRATVGSSFVSGTVETSIFKGDRFGGMTIANNTYQARWTWNNTIGYKFLKSLYIANSTNGNSFTVTIEASGNGSTWTTIATSTAMSNWPGHSWYNYAWNNNAYQGYIRITITPSWSTVYDINIYSMRYFCSYSLDAGARLYDWDYNRNVTFAAAVSSPIFYDSNNTAYFIDGAGTSNLLGLTVTNTITGSISGNAGTATTLQTARNINGTSFNGSANITTASWGTARTITIGSTGKSVDGSGNVSWSLAEIGAAATNQTMFIGTTSIAINRASASQTLSGISIDGNAATVTAGVYTNTTNTLTGINYFTSNLGTTSGSLSNPPLQAFASGTNAAFMSFHRGGSYAVNMGLDSDNVLRIGGWSASANRLQLDMSGNLTLAGVVDATQFRDSGNTAYYIDPASTSNIIGLTVANVITGNISGNAGTVTNGVYLSGAQTIGGVKTFSDPPVALNIAKAWVHFNGTSSVGVNCTVNASYNISSVAHNATGDYTVNFTNSFTDTNYVVAGTITYDYTLASSLYNGVLSVPRQSGAQSTGSCRIAAEYLHGANLYDAVAVRAVFFR